MKAEVKDFIDWDKENKKMYYISIDGEELYDRFKEEFLIGDEITKLITPHNYREIALENNAVLMPEIFYKNKRDAEKVRSKLNKILKNIKEDYNA